MNTPTNCPDRTRLQGLLDDHLPPEEQSALTGHLDKCAGCQEEMESLALADSGPALAAVLRDLERDVPDAQSAYWPALARTEQSPARLRSQALADVPLPFLTPAEGEGLLGRLSHFDIKRVVGRGGMGVVLHGFDACLERDVAIKVLDPQLANDETARLRFCREARAAAAVTHEHLVAVHQVDEDETSGLPFLVMHLVDGDSLEEHMARRRVEMPEIVRIGMEAALGLAAAHEHGLVHRDVKPGNILLEGPGLRVRLTDFGLALAAEDVRLTRTGVVAGTPLYMAPEQAKGEAVDYRADLFSLGGVLYELCAGRPPFEGNTPLAVLRRVADEPHQPLREVNPMVPEWLATAVDRLLAKDPAQRPASAREVAELFAAHWTPTTTAVTVLSQPSPRRPAIGGWARQNAGWLVAVGVLSLLLIALLVNKFVGGPRPAAPGDSPEQRAVLRGNAGPVWSVALTPDGQTLAMAIDDGTVKLWDVRTEAVSSTLNAHKTAVWAVAFSPSGKTLATGSSDTTVKLWDLESGAAPTVLKHVGAVRALAFDGSGKKLVSGCRNGSVTVWDVTTGKEAWSATTHEGEVVAVAFTRDGSMVASASGDKTVKLWDAANGRERLTLHGHEGAVFAVAFSPDGGTLASGGWDRTVRLWDVASGNAKGVLRSHGEDVWGVAYSPDGRRLVSVSEDRMVRLWNVATAAELASYRGHTGTVYAVTFSSDGHTVASGGRDGTVRLWNVGP